MSSVPVSRSDDTGLFDSILKAVVDAYYPDRVRSGTLARTRAQAALSAVTVFAGTLVGTFTATVLAEQPLWTRIVGIVAVALWLASTMAYVVAIAANLPSMPRANEVDSGPELVRAVLERATSETAAVDRRLRRANRLVGTALLASAVTLAGGVFISKAQFAPGVVIVTNKQAASIRSMCGGTGDNKINGRIDLSTLGTSFVVIEVSDCGTTSPSMLRVPRSEVTVIETRNG